MRAFLPGAHSAWRSHAVSGRLLAKNRLVDKVGFVFPLGFLGVGIFGPKASVRSLRSRLTLANYVVRVKFRLFNASEEECHGATNEDTCIS